MVNVRSQADTNQNIYLCCTETLITGVIFLRYAYKTLFAMKTTSSVLEKLLFHKIRSFSHNFIVRILVMNNLRYSATIIILLCQLNSGLLKETPEILTNFYPLPWLKLLMTALLIQGIRVVFVSVCNMSHK